MSPAPLEQCILDNVTSLQQLEERVKQEFRHERVKFNFSSISLRTDRIYVSREQAQRSINALERLIEERKSS